ncbi:MAG: TonB-dependent receptor domain-containing protein, partial [Acidobacteriota bacterium]
ARSRLPGRRHRKANTDFPVRTTVYPRSIHHLLAFRVNTERAGTWQAAVHARSLDTDVTEAPFTRTGVHDDSFDFSSGWQRRVVISDALTSRVGIDLFGRRGVDARQTRLDLDPNSTAPTTRTTSLAGAHETEVGAFATLGGAGPRSRFEIGARAKSFSQGNRAASGRHDRAASGHASLVTSMAPQVLLAFHVGTGLRFPSLTERFFSGTTGRGQIAGNPALDAERSFDTQIELRKVSTRWLLTSSVFRTRIDDFIERVEVAPDDLTFINLTSGTLTGLDLHAVWHASTAWRVGFGGNVIDGETAAGANLSDVTPASLFASLHHRGGRWSTAARWTVRARKADPGSGEKSISGAHLLSASLTFQATPDWRVAMTATNLLDDAFFPAADRKASLAPGRSVGLSLTWADR